MDMAHHTTKTSGRWGIIFLAGVATGGVLGWLARTLGRAQAGRGPTRQVNPIQVQTYLTGVDYPTGKQGLLARARAEGADAQVLETLTHLPEQCYRSPIDVSRAMGQRGSSGAGASHGTEVRHGARTPGSPGGRG
jgi:uncharacterized protein DUF2795